MKPTVITDEMIRTYGKSPESKRDLCEQIVANLAENNPREHFAFNESGVFFLDATGTILLIFSWTIMGTFHKCQPTLNVTAYVDRNDLTIIQGTAA